MLQFHSKFVSTNWGFTISGGAGIDTIKGGAGNDIITGSGSNDVFHIISGTDAVTDLTTGDSFIVSASATLNAANISGFVATDGTSNAGTANLSADNSDVTIDMRLATSGVQNYWWNRCRTMVELVRIHLL